MRFRACRLCGLVSTLFLAAVSHPTHGAEIDSLTGRTEVLDDSSGAIERRVNDALKAGVDRANRVSTGCDEDVLYRELRSALASPFIGHVIAESLNLDEALDRRRIRRVDSIYRDLGLLDNVSVHWKDLSAVVRVGDVLIGVDKVGHFVVEGWHYFESAYLEGEGIVAAMDWGEGTESTYFGLYTTGVYSYADLVADFEGLRFWLHVLGRFDDPLDTGWLPDRPYVTCRRRFWIAGERRWHLSRRLHLDRYVTPVWDEAVNCCRYRNEEIEARVRARIDELSRAAGVDYTCPIDPDACAQARRRYGEWAPHLLHPTCLEAPPGRRPWWKLCRVIEMQRISGACEGASSRTRGLTHHSVGSRRKGY
jgi:hypothetical protein